MLRLSTPHKPQVPPLGVRAQAYVGEQAFRFNERKGTDLTRFRSVLGSVFGKRLTWKDLTSHDLSAAF